MTSGLCLGDQSFSPRPSLTRSITSVGKALVHAFGRESSPRTLSPRAISASPRLVPICPDDPVMRALMRSDGRGKPGILQAGILCSARAPLRTATGDALYSHHVPE